MMTRHFSFAPCALLTLSVLLIVTSCAEYNQTEPPGPDFYSLFNGSDLSGWNIEPDEGAWYAENGWIHCKGEPQTPYLILTEKEYENFEFYAEFKVSKECNSGIFFHVPKAGRQSRLGFEAQILDDAGKQPDKNATGAIYDVVPPLTNAMRRAGRWNRYRVLFDWPLCKIWLNGTLVQDTDFSAHPELKYRLRRGPIGLSNHGYVVDYRNLWISELPDTDTGAVAFNGVDLSGWFTVGDADWHVENGMITSTKGEGYLVSERELEKVYFHAYVKNDTLSHRNASFFYRWKSPDDPGYPLEFLDYLDAVKYTEQYGDTIPGDVIQPMRSGWFIYRIISADRESLMYLNEFVVSENKLLGKPPMGRIAIYRSPEDGVIQIRDVKIRRLEGMGIYH